MKNGYSIAVTGPMIAIESATRTAAIETSVSTVFRSPFHARTSVTGITSSGLISRIETAPPASLGRPARRAMYAPAHERHSNCENWPSMSPCCTGNDVTNPAIISARHGRSIGSAMCQMSAQFSASSATLTSVHTRYASSGERYENGAQISAKNGGLKYGSAVAWPSARSTPSV